MESRPSRKIVAGILALLVSLLIAMPAAAWDAGGHEVIATLAYARLNPKAQKAVTELAGQMQNPEQTYDAITVACWMDDLRKNIDMPYHGLFLGWHFIDIGLDPTDPQPPFEPGTDDEIHGDVVQALKRTLVVLKGGTDPYVTTKAMACAMAMHLVGDIHQPLHCSTKYFHSGGRLRNDAGGNREEVINGPPGRENGFSLHAFWDSAWRASFDQASGCVMLDDHYTERGAHDPALVRPVVEMLSQQPPPVGADLEPHFDSWARESNAIVRDFAYRDLTATESKKWCRLGSGYVAQANTLARQRLVLAACRLATLLNETLGAEVPLPPPAPPTRRQESLDVH